MTQRAIGIIVIIVGVAFLAIAALLIVRARVRDAVTEDRAISSEMVRNTQVEAERAAQADAEQDKLVAERARQQQMEAINESMYQPGGDPAAAVYDRLRRQSAPAR